MANKKPSIEELKAKAEGGDVEAMMKLASIYGSDDNEDYGLDGPDKTEANKWYKLASDSGNPEATYYLAMNIEDLTEGLKLLKKAAKMGFDEAYLIIGTVYRRKGDVKNSLYWYKALYEKADAEAKYRISSAREIGSIYEKMGSYKEYQNAVIWYKNAAGMGCSMSAWELAKIYEKGVRSDLYIKEHSYDHHTIIKKDEKEAAKWYLVAAEIGNDWKCAHVSDMYLKGICVSRSYQKALLWMLKAACYDESSFIPQIIPFYEKGIGIEQSYYEAYVWALIVSDGSFDYKIEELEKELNQAERHKAQEEASYRRSLVDEVGFSQALYDYMLSKIDAADTGSVIDKEVKPEKPALPEVEKERFDPDPTPGIAYSYLSVCKKHFNPKLVTLELVVPRNLNETEEMDFTQIKISYDRKDTDVKNIDVFHQLKVHKRTRRLLILLAAQFSDPDPEQRKEKLHKILTDPKEETHVSLLNKMFRAIFPGCAMSRRERAFNRETGHIAPRLKIYTYRIANARDYPLCGL